VDQADYTRCRFCGHRWLGLPLGLWEHIKRGDRTPGMGDGKDIKCPECGLGGSSVVVDSDPQGQLL
jgi:hypothetical protein